MRSLNGDIERRQRLQKSLERLANQQCELLGVLVGLAVEVSVALQDSLDQCAASQQRLRDVHGRLYESIQGREGQGQEQGDWEQVAREAVELQTSCSGQELEEMMFAKTETHTLTITSSQGREWRAEGVKLQDEPVTRLALLLLLQGGKLHLQPQQPPRDANQRAPPAFQRQMSVGTTMITATAHTQAVQPAADPRVLSNMWCDHDPQWTLSVLEKHAPLVEELQLYDVGQEHLQVALNMPRLRKLRVWDWHGELQLPDPPDRDTLQWLEVRLPEPEVQGLLRAHRDSLRELRLCVGLPRQDGKPGRWPSHCGHLPALLRRCALPRLAKLTLLRSCLAEHCADLCRAQLEACRAALPRGCAALCSKCHSEDAEGRAEAAVEAASTEAAADMGPKLASSERSGRCVLR